MSYRSPFQPLRLNSSCAFIDNDQDLLEILELVMQRHARTLFFEAPKLAAALDQRLRRNEELLEAERGAVQAIVATQDLEANTRAAPLVHQFFADPARLEIVGVLIADHHMPVENGIPLCARHRQIGLQRLLLTGVADEAEAIAAFNQGSIEYFMPKQADSDQMNQMLVQEVKRQRALSAEVRGRPLLTCQDPQVLAALETKAASAALQGLLDELQIVEYMMLGLPAGMFALSSDRRTYWLQFETDRDHLQMLDAMRDDEWPEEAQQRVSTGTTMVNFDWMRALELRPTEIPARELSNAPYLAVGISDMESLPTSLQPAHFP